MITPKLVRKTGEIDGPIEWNDGWRYWYDYFEKLAAEGTRSDRETVQRRQISGVALAPVAARPRHAVPLCPRDEAAEETRRRHEVWAASLEYREFLERGKPVAFDVPKQPGPVVSAVRLDNRVLARRTDFDGSTAPVKLSVGRQIISVPRAEGHCQILNLTPWP